MIVKLGNWLFHYRNMLFPFFYAMLFVPSRPVFGNMTYAFIVGGIIIFIGMAVRITTIGLVYIERGGKNRRIYAGELVTEGIYNVCRNPMYLGNALLLLGFGLFANSLIFTLVFVPLFVGLYIAIILAEEAFLYNKFGQEYTSYKKNTNRIIPRLSSIKGAYRDQTFKWQKVVSKEHNSMFLYFTGILLILYHKTAISYFAFIIIFIVIFTNYLSVKLLKKRKVLDA